jgi:hypothetical protein
VAEKNDEKQIQLGQNLAKNCDRDSEVKICLQPGLEAQKVLKHCPTLMSIQFSPVADSQTIHKFSWKMVLVDQSSILVIR